MHGKKIVCQKQLFTMYNRQDPTKSVIHIENDDDVLYIWHMGTGLGI